jgi:hypothetical protein
MTPQAAKLSAVAAKPYILGGNATFTVVSLKTGSRYVYRVRQAEDKPFWFVGLLTGPDNDSSYTYLGVISGPAPSFRLTQKSKMNDVAVPVVAFKWLLGKLNDEAELSNTEIWHSGHCGRCGHTLTVPASIASGFGPECIKKAA